MQSVQVAQPMLKAGNENCRKHLKKLDLIWAYQKGFRKRLVD